jgi:hypothetical protein
MAQCDAMSKSNCAAVNARIVAATVAGSEQGFVKSDKGSGFQHPLKTLNKAQVLFNHIFVLRVGGFADNNYWSSSENSSNNAWKQNFNNGNQNNLPR